MIKFYNYIKSIGNKISVVFAIIMFVCVASLFICNTFFLEKIYIKNRAEVLEGAYKSLNEFLMNSFDNGVSLESMFGKLDDTDKPETSQFSRPSYLAEFMSKLQDTFNVQVVIIDSNSKVYSLWRSPKRLDAKLNNYIFNNADFQNNKNIKLIEKTDNYQIVLNNMSSFGNANNNNQNNALECWGFFDDNETSFLLSTPLISIKEPIAIFNNIIIAWSIITICIGIIIVYIAGNKIASPIKKLSILAFKMSKMDFSEKYLTGKRSDEIEQLGKSMNRMSETLERTISDLQKANFRLQNDLKEKEKLDIMRQEFIANVSHELKTPIALIQGYAEGLTEGLCEIEETRDYYCNVIMDEARKMNKIVRQLLNLSSIERGNEVLDIVDFNLRKLTETVVLSCKLLLDEKKLNCNIDINENINIKADELKAEEVIKNFLTNAINHVDDNKIINIYTMKIAHNKVRLCIYNSGVTLSEENLKMVWEKFYKVDKAHTRSYGGTGLGLPIIKAIAKQHNTNCGCFNIENDTTLKNGIVFYFDWDLAT